MEAPDQNALHQPLDLSSPPNNGNTEALLNEKVPENGNLNEIQHELPDIGVNSEDGHHIRWRDSIQPCPLNGNNPETKTDSETAILNKMSLDLCGLSHSELVTENLQNLRKLQEAESKVEYLEHLCQKLKKEFPAEEDIRDQNQNTCRNESEVTQRTTPATSPSPNLLITASPVLEASDSFALVPSPCVTTPPYEYIVLTKNNEKKLRIFVNPKIDSLFKAELTKLKSQEEEGDGENDNPTFSPTPSILPLPHKSSDATIIHCFDPSDVDVELKHILKGNPPLSHRIVRRKPRPERGSSVPAIDSYYGTQDLERVGHASYFIPELTASERKIIGWKDQYSYGLWKYSNQKITRENSSSGKSLFSGTSLKELVRKTRSDGHKNKTCITTPAAATHKLFEDGCKDMNPKVIGSIPRTSIFRTILRGHGGPGINSDSLNNFQRADSRIQLLSVSSLGSTISGTYSTTTSCTQQSCFAKRTNHCGKNRRTLQRLVGFLLPCYKRQEQDQTDLAPVSSCPTSETALEKKIVQMDEGDNLFKTAPNIENLSGAAQPDTMSNSTKKADINMNPTESDQQKSHGKAEHDDNHRHHHHHHHGHHHHHHRHHHGHQHHHHGHQHHHHTEKILLGCFHHKPAPHVKEVLGGDVLLSADDSIVSVSSPAMVNDVDVEQMMPTRKKEFELIPISAAGPSPTIIKTGMDLLDENLNNNNPSPPPPDITPTNTTISDLLMVKYPTLEVTSEAGNSGSGSGSATISTVPTPSMQVSSNSFHSDHNEHHEDLELDADQDYDHCEYDEIDDFAPSASNNHSASHYLGPIFAPLSPLDKKQNHIDQDDIFDTVPETRFLDMKDLALSRYQYKKTSINFVPNQPVEDNFEEDDEFDSEFYEGVDGDDQYETAQYSNGMNISTANNNNPFLIHDKFAALYDLPLYSTPNTTISATILKNSGNNNNNPESGSGSGGGGSSKKPPIVVQDCKVV